MVAGLAIYAWKDWYKSLCGLIIMMAFIEHPEMPKNIMGIQGLNPWNILLLIILFAWGVQRSKENLKWDMPWHINMLLVLYLIIVLTGFVRMLQNWDGMVDWAYVSGTASPTVSSLWSDYLINTIKWVIPGILLFDGCRSKERLTLALFSLLAIYLLIALQVIRWMPLNTALSGGQLSERSARVLVREVGYHRVDLSMMLAGASWAVFVSRLFMRRKIYVCIIIMASSMILFAQMLTGGRTGYATWAIVGIVLCSIRWRRYLFMMPLVVVVLIWVVPGAMDRLSQGFDEEEESVDMSYYGDAYLGDSKYDFYTITAGRTVAWPHVIKKIGGAPLFGYGRRAMQRTGISSFLWLEYTETFPHPHNAYLQMLLDNGLFGFVPIMLFYVLIIKYSLFLFHDPTNLFFALVGGVTFALVGAQLFASLGSQTFYPREDVVGMWCAIGLMLRLMVERIRIQNESGYFSWINADRPLVGE